MKLIQCRYSSGQRVPLLVQDGQAAPLPKLVPFIYVHLRPAQAQASCIQHRRSAPACDPGFLHLCQNPRSGYR